ncbi:MAG TPA: TRAFs-binding domain-containing protein [Candidatus Baltobacteraceae bacterium]|nr:TRAFs-binding domain-containing protein [Candidatus Baltobacteraceae bacterium]
MPFLPLVFVAMPFRKKFDASHRFEIDFDDIYDRAMRPAFESLEDRLDYIRADEERAGGIIHVPMFERLLVAEIAVVDVTIPNPNVYYELGIRHGAKPATTIIVGAFETLPFDIALAQAVPYLLDEGKLSDESAASFAGALREKLEYALAHVDGRDSPIFQLIPALRETSLPHDITESFRDRAKYMNETRDRLDTARRVPEKQFAQARETIAAIEREMGAITKTNAELLFDVMLAYRDVQAYAEMIALAERAPEWLRDQAPVLVEQEAFALNRRNEDGDRDRAVSLLEAQIRKRGHSPETSSLLARIYKDRYVEALKAGEARAARGALARAIELYRAGFEADPRDYYPGINLATLLTLEGSADSLTERERVAQAVLFALGRLGGLNSSDYWQVATVLESALMRGDAATVNRALDIIASLRNVPSWCYKSTKGNLKLLRLAPSGAMDRTLLDEAIAELAKHAG